VPQFTEADAEAIATQIGGVAAWRRRARQRHRGGQRPQLVHQRHRQHQRLVRHRQLEAGRRAHLRRRRTELAGAAVCIVGETVRREIFGGTVGSTGLGEQLRIKQFSCEVIGILAAKGQGGMGDQDDTVVVPLHTCSAASPAAPRSAP
jgi:putative ABC transport system permease protein